MATKNTHPLTICVYCGAANNVNQSYKDIAKDCGETLAKENIGVVYGGGRVGLMGIVADSVIKNDGKVIGIIPSHIQDREPKHNELTELHIVETMHERKMLMEEKSDGFLILPGGFGTMDETFEIITWKVLGLHDKPIVLLNTNGYWDTFLKLIDNIISEEFAQEKDRNFEVLETMTEAINYFNISTQK